MSRATRGERLLTALGSKVGLTEDGKQWLIAALDPFHDLQIKCNGLPDAGMGDSLVQCVKQSITIATPTGLAGANWDAHVTLFPFLATSSAGTNFNSYAQANAMYNSFTVPATPSMFPIFPLNIVSSISGASLNPFDATITLASGSREGLVMNELFLRGKARVIGMGFEIYNTTSDLYKQGSVVVYRSSVPEKTTAASVNFINTAPFSTSAVFIDNVPTTQAEAINQPGSRQWDAKEGCYCVAALNTLEIRKSCASSILPIFVDRGSDVNSNLPAAVWAPTTQSSGQSKLLNFLDFDVSGAYFTGLSPQTTLTINWNVYIERFPTASEPDLVVLTKPSPDYCCAALELYKMALGHLPPGVMVKENGLGEWFADIVSDAQDYLGPVLSAIPHPAAKAMGAGVSVAGGVAKGIKAAIKSKETKKEIAKDVKRIEQGQNSNNSRSMPGPVKPQKKKGKGK